MIAATMMDFPLTLSHVLERAGALFGSTEIVSRLPDRSLHRYTYREFHRRVLALAAALQGLGLRKGDRVATLMWNHYAHLEAYLAVPCAGGVLHTLNLRLHPDDIAYIANHAGDRFLIIDDALLPLYEKFSKLTAFERVIVVRMSAVANALGDDYEQLIAANPVFTPPALAETDAAGMCYTSGTTGRPKGVGVQPPLDRAAYACDCDGRLPRRQQRDTLCPVVPMFHVNAWGLPYTALMMGAKLAMPGPHLDAVSLLDLYEAERVTITAGVPTIWLGIQQALEHEPERWRLTRGMRMVVGGAAVPEALIRALDRYDLQVIHGWGMTETSPVGLVNCTKGELKDRGDRDEELSYALRTKQGVPLPFFEIRAVAGKGVAPWDGKTMGELQVRGPWVAASYHDLAGGIEQWTADGWFRTGDIVTIDRGGLRQDYRPHQGPRQIGRRVDQLDRSGECAGGAPGGAGGRGDRRPASEMGRAAARRSRAESRSTV